MCIRDSSTGSRSGDFDACRGQLLSNPFDSEGSRFIGSVLTGFDVGTNLLLRLVVDVRYPCPALEHPPRTAAFDAEQDHHPGQQQRPHLPCIVLGFDRDTEVGYERDVFRIEDMPLDDIVLGDDVENLLERDGPVKILRRLEVPPEPRLCGCLLYTS